MAVPARRVSKTRKRMRRSHMALTENQTTTCTNCGATIRPHRVCRECGFYKGSKVIVTKAEKRENN
ncbi:MAG: 50S ribosomal protein L32 [Bacilli bacterium]